MKFLSQQIRAVQVLALILLLGACRPDPEVNEPPAREEIARLQVIQDEIEGIPVVLAGNPDLNLIVSFHRSLDDGTLANFSPSSEPLPVVMQDDEGNLWDVFGRAVEGPRTGQQLGHPYAMMGYWFVFGAMYPGVEIYGEGATSINIGLQPDSGWTIPLENVKWGSAWDGIPSIDQPQFVTYNQRDHLDASFLVQPDDLVTGVRLGDDVRAYPHKILNWHEVVNDQLDGQNVSILWCPLAGTGTVWSRDLANGTTTHGVAGLLYNNNLMVYDRDSESIWSQIRSDCVHGDLQGNSARTFPMVETTFKTWLKIVKEPLVLSSETGVQRDYENDDFDYYQIDHDYIIYPNDYDDPRLPAKERVHAIIVGGTAKVYRFSSFR